MEKGYGDLILDTKWLKFQYYICSCLVVSQYDAVNISCDLYIKKHNWYQWFIIKSWVSC